MIDINLNKEFTVILSSSTSALHHALLRLATYWNLMLPLH